MGMTNAELAVLGLVVETPRHAYEIEQVIAERDMRNWTDVGFSSIYYLLRKMERQGLLIGRATPGTKGPARTVYHPTTDGLVAWTEASIAALGTAQAKTPFLLGLSALGGLPEDRALDAARTCLRTLDERLAAVREKRRATGDAEWFVGEVFDYSEHSLGSAREWVAGFVRRLERRRSTQMRTKMKPFVPEIAELPAQTMAVVHTVGDPTDAGSEALPALYGAVYPLRFALKKQGIEYRIETARARWFGGADWASLPRERWEAAWAIPVPDGTTEVVQKDPKTPVTIETWEYGRVAQVLYVGSYAEETPTIEELHGFIEREGYEIAGPHEEEYRSSPEAKDPKTVIRYQVRERS